MRLIKYPNISVIIGVGLEESILYRDSKVVFFLLGEGAEYDCTARQIQPFVGRLFHLSKVI